MTATYKQTTTLNLAVEKPLENFVRTATRKARNILEFRLSPQGDTRTGNKHKNLARRSSVNRTGVEFPQQQRLNGIRSKVKIRRVSQYVFEFGIMDANFGQLLALEFGRNDIDYQARRPVTRVALDADTHRQMLIEGVAAMKIV